MVLDAGRKQPGHGVDAHLRLGRRVRAGNRHQQRHRIAHRHAELVGERLAEQHAVGAGIERGPLAGEYQRLHPRNRRLALRIDAPQRHRHHVAAVHGQRLQVHVRGHADHSRELPQACGQGFIVHQGGRPRVDDARVRREAQQAVTQLALESVHHRQHDDQGRDPQGHAPQRYPGDEGHEVGVLAGAHVAQAHEQ